MKRQYTKPLLVKREALSTVTADNGSLIQE